MRLSLLLLTALVAAGPAWAQSPSQPSAPASSSSTGENPRETRDDSVNLPVSLEKIQQALSQPPALSLRGINEATADQAVQFRIEVKERQKIEELMSTLDFKSGPAVPGGMAAAEIQRLTNGSVDHPLTQPLAAFSTSELLTITVENLVGKYLGGRAINSVSTAERERAEHAAREEVAQAMAEFCAEQPKGGAGLQGCSFSGH
jgi:hypothetical protein